jgi:hypothetical protein
MNDINTPGVCDLDGLVLDQIRKNANGGIATLESVGT